MATKLQVREAQEARERLLKMVKPGDTVYTILRSVSRSGMQREISVVLRTDDGIHEIDYLVCRLLGDHLGKAGIKVTGGGMDMGFHLVHGISYRLFQGRFECIGDSTEYGKRCPSNDHSNERERDFTIGRQHSDGGYALRQTWL